eukprot:gnl/TRDRNA2_/TRDRNA2_156252_c0_seq1.p1 gnl/TRDRNA2_/TRDRNA2_156252_c0~~gnl/TRDRNA2_/TRDRNA2_156252_c0_seq1.p1  ORF type:complete len:406 (-),score=54.37 gnl/TRDRNA2_/TRDRNA2_156252_c0_seq1:107-1198(-)
MVEAGESLVAHLLSSVPESAETEKCCIDIFGRRRPRGSPLVPCGETGKEEDDPLMHEMTTAGGRVAAFVVAELLRLDAMLRVVRKSLASLEAAIAGSAQLSQALNDVLAALLDGKVPKEWREVAYPSRKPLFSWVLDLQDRVAVIKIMVSGEEWIMPDCFYISHFFSPRGLLTSVLQDFAKSHSLPIDRLEFSHTVISALGDADDIEGPPDEGVYIVGIHVHGSRWDVHTEQIEDCRPREPVTRLPVVQFMPYLVPEAPRQNTRRSSRGRKDSADSKTMTSTRRPSSLPPGSAQGLGGSATTGAGGRSLARFDCPLYRTMARAVDPGDVGPSTNFVCSIALPTAADASNWVCRGTALVCETDD